jgi:hypothetical protein
VKRSTNIAFALATALTSSLAAYAQSEQPTVHRHYHHYYPPHHAVHHHYAAHNPAPAVGGSSPVVTAPAPQTPAFGLSLPQIAPYPNDKGDEDGLSEDEDDCNKGCIDGNTSGD